MDVAAALSGGLIGAIVMAVFYAGFVGLRLTRLDLLRFEGGLLVHERTGLAYLYGVMVQLVLGAVAALVYRLVFEQIHSATYVGWGALAGLVHGLLVLAILPLLGLVNRNVRAGDQRPPGLAGLAYGRFTPLALVAAHVVFGIWVGLFLIP